MSGKAVVGLLLLLMAVFLFMGLLTGNTANILAAILQPRMLKEAA